jgi:hypothetical protein
MLNPSNVFLVLNLREVKMHQQGHHVFQLQNQQVLELDLRNLVVEI